MKHIKTYKQLNESAWDVANDIAEKRFGEFGISTLKSDELEMIIDVKKADEIAKKEFGEFGFSTCTEEQQKEIINKNPTLVKK